MKQTIKQAMHLAKTGRSRALGRARFVLDGLPVGGWAETQQAYMRLREELPFRTERGYTVAEFISEAYEIRGEDARSSGRYYTREA